MPSYPISNLHLREAADAIVKNHGNLACLPEELANCVANVFYRFRLCSIIYDDVDDVYLVPYLGSSRHEMGYVEYIEQISRLRNKATTLQPNLVYETLPALKQTRSDAPEQYAFVCGIMIDALKYDMGPTLHKSSLQRSIERRFARVRQIADLILVMAKENAAVYSRGPSSETQRPPSA
jgi:hypothetical protein